MDGKGIIIKTNGPSATVRIRKSSACGHDCGECRVCNNPEIETDVLNPINAKPGDCVLIGADTGAVLLNAFLLYILPIIGAMAVYVLSSVFGAGKTAIIAMIVLWLVLWFGFMRYYSKNKVIKSCVLEVIHEKA